MTLTITPKTETLLLERAEMEGQDVNALADSLLASVLREEARDHAEMLEGIQRGLEASDAGRVRPLSEFAADMRTKYNLPTHLSDEKIFPAKKASSSSKL